MFECEQCPPAQYQNKTGQSHCEDCPLNSLHQKPFNWTWLISQNNASQYDDLTLHQPSVELGAPNISYCSCQPGSYKHLELSRLNGYIVCIPCIPANGLDAAMCPGSVKDSNHRDHIQPYPMQSAAMISGTNITDIHAVWCEPEEACLGGPPGGARAGICNEGYRGEACGECDTLYYREAKFCVTCPPVHWWSITFLGIGIVGGTYVFVSISPYVKGLASIRILYNYMQFSYRLRLFSLPWPPSVVAFFNFLYYLAPNLDVLRPGL
jgi:hypothetical protein